MSLSPDVTPFVPSRQQPAKPSAQSHLSNRTLWEPSVDVAEFVPSWLNNKPKSSTEYIETSNVSEARRVSAKVEEKNGKDEKSVEKKERKINSTKKGPKQKANPAALKTNHVTSSSGKDDNSKLEGDKHETENLSWNTDFPALGAKSGHYKTPIWNKPLGVSFSDKLKTGNTSSYSYDEPSSEFNDKTKEQEKTSIKSKDDEDECKKIVNMNKEEVDSTPSEYGFSVVKSKSKKKYEAMEHSKKEGKSFRHKNIPLAWDKVDSDEKTNSVMKGVKKSSNNRSKTSVECTGKDYKQDGIVPKSRLSEEWATGKDIANDKREAMRDSHKGNRRTKQSFKPAEDYYNFKSTHRGLNLEEKHYEESDHEERRTSRPPVSISTAMTTPSLSYSDILKSKSNTKVPIEGSKNEKGFLRIPSEKSENEGVDEKEVEEQGKRKKKKKKKKKSGIETQPQTVKKSKEALTLDFGDMLEKIMESSASKKKPIIRTGGFLPAQAPLPPKETRTSRRPQMQAANVLDSTAPIVFRSKEREFPKKKKPSAMRKILRKEREDKKMLREGKSSTEIQTSDDEKSDKQSSDEQGLDEE
ncbi:selenocysteine insertion sequence-binding protein 2-like isoform X2 [Dendronephthya gigantea]|uniref:selenocysteine insertion sequence-binding protein 2-like isoform X2 n=1 Tax=Dendronephthya gigantea TaxID=151771 RepID=UPI00106A9AFD|nr:selenocysteine insertion sequence-binding protein 2-like isoform X2 [Dendronephthya gigantea]